MDVKSISDPVTGGLGQDLFELAEFRHCYVLCERCGELDLQCECNQWNNSCGD